MAYVRNHGNQIAIVHGERDAESGAVRQRVLFKICSKPEALAAIGKGGGRGWNLEGLLENKFRHIKLDWSKIRKGIEERMDDLPEIYPYKQAELMERFREDLCRFVRQLGHADPQTMYSASELIREHRAELEYVRDLIDWRLRVCEQVESEWNGDNEFFWRCRTQDDDVPPEVIEQMSKLYLDGDLERLEALARMFLDCYPDYVDGHNYLGLVARDRGDLDGAMEHFQRAIEEGRKLFPKRLAKKHYWSDMDTRPYMRGLHNLAQTLHLADRFDDALAVCDRLERECGDDLTAAAFRAHTLLVAGRYEEARDAANYVVRIWPWYAYIAALASYELGEEESAAGWFLHGLLTSPRAGRMLLGLRTKEPKSFDEVRDHNNGVDLCRQLAGYLDKPSSPFEDFFERILFDARTEALLQEKAVVDAGWRDDRKLSARRTEVESLDFAFRSAATVLGSGV